MLVIQIFKEMNKIMLKINENFKFTLYDIVACDKLNGFMQFVPNSETLQDINVKNKLLQISNDINSPVYSDLIRQKGEKEVK